MMEPSEYKERDDGVGDTLSDLRVREKSDDEDDVGLSRLKVNVRRQDSSKEEVYLGKFMAFKQCKRLFSAYSDRKIELWGIGAKRLKDPYRTLSKHTHTYILSYLCR